MGEPIWLVGMMGAGKTTVAPLVAERLGRHWADTDRVVEAQTGRTVRELLTESEAGFRQAETAAVESLSEGDDVVATGGGVVTSDAATVLTRRGFVVWLRASVDTLLTRLDGVDRPLLDEGAAAAILSRLATEREARYAEVSNVTVDTDGLTPEEAADLVVRAWASASLQA